MAAGRAWTRLPNDRSNFLLMGHAIGAARVTAITRQLDSVSRVVTICAAVLLALWGRAVAGRMSALVSFSHMRFLHHVDAAGNGKC
jgi:hypothetical protein